MTEPSNTETPDRFPRWVWPAMAAILAFCTPWWVPQSWVEPVVWGLPFWGLLMVGGFTGLAAFTAWVFSVLWRDDDEEPAA